MNPRCVYTHGKIKKLEAVVHLHNVLGLKRKVILTFVAAWMDLESIMLSEISQSEKDKCHMMSLICGI